MRKIKPSCATMEVIAKKREYLRRIEALRAEQDLYTFLQQAWRTMEGEVPFTDGWHIQAIAEHLQACFERKIKRLLINVPPRSSKTSLISIAFPAWVWLHNPEEKFVYASYVKGLSEEHSQNCRNLIASDWYQKNWGHKYQLSKGQNTKSFFKNSEGGYRLIAVSRFKSSSATGRGGTILICDDPNNAKDGESEATRKDVLSFWQKSWASRLNDLEQGVKIVVQQRLHEQDVSGHILENDTQEEWVKLILPMEFETARRSKTIILPSSKGKVWQDPRTKEGSLLCPQRFNPKHIAEYKRELGSYGYAGQYQQRPSPADGGIFKKSWFPWWKSPEVPPLYGVVQSWDTAYSEKPTSDYSACTTWGLWKDNHDVDNMVLLGIWRGRVEYHELLKRAKRLHFDYRDTDKEKNPALKGREVHICLIEATGFGDQLIRDLTVSGIAPTPYHPKKHGDKIRRAHLVSPLIEDGRVWLPAQPPHYTTLLPFAQELEHYAILFPRSDSRDVIDTLTQALIHLRNGFNIGLKEDQEDDDPLPPTKPVKAY